MKKACRSLVWCFAGALVGIFLWTALATALIIAYWIGYEFIYVGLFCGGGKLGFNWFNPPTADTQQTVRGWVIAFTSFAFTFGEALAAIGGALFFRFMNKAAARLQGTMQGSSSEERL